MPDLQQRLREAKVRQHHKSTDMLPFGAPKPWLLDVARPKDTMRSSLIHYDPRLCTAPNVLPYVLRERLVMSKRLKGHTADVSNVMQLVCIDMHVQLVHITHVFQEKQQHAPTMSTHPISNTSAFMNELSQS